MDMDQKRYELQLMATPDSWRLYSARNADPAFKTYQTKVFNRDEYRCGFCGFQSKIHQDVVNIDGDYRRNQLSNMVTACCFCAQCFFVESVGVGGYGGADLVYLPEWSQVSLNALCHVLFCAIANDSGYKNTAQNIYRSFKVRTQVVEKQFGEGTSDPSILGHLLIDTGNINNDVSKKILKDLRMLPSRAKFRRQIEAWSTSAIEALHQQA